MLGRDLGRRIQFGQRLARFHESLTRSLDVHPRHLPLRGFEVAARPLQSPSQFVAPGGRGLRRCSRAGQSVLRLGGSRFCLSQFPRRIVIWLRAFGLRIQQQGMDPPLLALSTFQLRGGARREGRFQHFGFPARGGNCRLLQIESRRGIR